MELSIGILLDYLYNKFAITFVFSLVGISIKDIVTVGKNTTARFRLKTMIASSLFCTIVLCAINDYMNLSFSVYALICVLVGIWSRTILHSVTNNKFMSKFIANLLKKISGPVTEALSETIDDKNKSKKPNNKDSTKSNKKKEDQDNCEQQAPEE